MAAVAGVAVDAGAAGNSSSAFYQIDLTNCAQPTELPQLIMQLPSQLQSQAHVPQLLLPLPQL